MPCTWGIGNTPNGVPPIPVAFTAPSLTLVHPRRQTRGDGAHAMYVAWAMGIGNMPSSDHEPVAVTTPSFPDMYAGHEPSYM